MDLGTALNVVTTLAVVAGLLFAGLQIRDAKRARTAEERLVLVRSFESPDFMRAPGSGWWQPSASSSAGSSLTVS